MKKYAKDGLKILVFLGLGILLVWWVVRGFSEQDKEHILNSMRSANFFWLGLSILLGGLSHFSRSLRWRLALKPMGYNPGVINTFLAVMIGYFANLGVPRLGEVVRCGILYTYERVPVQRSLGAVITERVIDLIMLGLAFVLAIAMEYDVVIGFAKKELYSPFMDKLSGMADKGYLLIIAGIAAVSLIFIYFAVKRYLHKLELFHKFKAFLKGLLEGVQSIRKLDNPLMYIFHSVFIWVMYFAMLYICFFSMEATSNLSVGTGMVILAIGSVAMIIVQGGLGAYPVFVQGVLLLYSVDALDGYAFGWLVWSAQTLMIIIFGSISLMLLPILNRNKEKAPDNSDGSQSVHTV